jgi:hypothetical protein
VAGLQVEHVDAVDATHAAAAAAVSAALSFRRTKSSCAVVQRHFRRNQGAGILRSQMALAETTTPSGQRRKP